MAKPNKSMPERTVRISCAKCHSVLYKYKKGGKGALVKCFVERIVEDHTIEKCQCPNCGLVFARETMIRGTPAYKIIGGKVQVK